MQTKFGKTGQGKFKPWQNVECQISTATSQWSGLYLEYLHATAHTDIPPAHLPEPIAVLICEGEPQVKWRARGVRYIQRWRPGTVLVQHKDLVIDDAHFGSDYDMLVVRLNDTFAGRWMGVEARRPELLPLVVTEDARIAAFMRCMLDEVSNGCPCGRLYDQSLSLALLSYISARYSSSHAVSLNRTNGLSQSALERLIDFMHENFANDLRLDDLAQLVDLSPAHLCRSFKLATGMGPFQYLLKIRIEKSKCLLTLGRQSVAEIALASGFSSQSHFSNAFRKQVGVSPRRFVIGR